jgi:UDP-N-acetylglucosamine 4,6-dehydratase/5-epimerase
MLSENVKEFYKNKDILVTGGIGSIGREIVKELLTCSPRLIRVFDNNESEMFYLNEELEHRENTRFLMGDIRDKERLTRAVKGVDVIFHAAALKHVPICEFDPFEAVMTNVLGTQNIVEAARNEGVDVFLGISTDKVVSPINTMGATKLLAEKLTINGALGDYESKIHYKTKFSCVRFGNVLNSRGSVIPIFKKQIAKGGPLKLTHPNMTRFFMSIEDSVKLVLEAGAKTTGREIFVLKMETLRIKDLAESMIKHLAPAYGHQPSNIAIDIIGKRSGEKMHEQLMSEDESVDAVYDKEYIIIKPPFVSPTFSEEARTAMPTKYCSSMGPYLTKKEIIDKLQNSNSV